MVLDIYESVIIILLKLKFKNLNRNLAKIKVFPCRFKACSILILILIKSNKMKGDFNNEKTNYSDFCITLF